MDNSHSLSHKIEKDLKMVEDHLNSIKIEEKIPYKKWFEIFGFIYGRKNAKPRLFIITALIYHMGYVILAEFLEQVDVFFILKMKQFQKFTELKESIDKKFDIAFNSKISIFDFILNFLNQSTKEIYMRLLFTILTELMENNLPVLYRCDFLMQNVLSPIIRHKSGEFYTPPFLVKYMVKESYEFGASVLDPSCGTGNFLIEIIRSILSTETTKSEKYRAIKNVHGFDINPISIALTRINVILLSHNLFENLAIDLHVVDALFDDVNDLKSNVDLVIGNPPWYTLRDIELIEYQKKVKDLAELLEIKPLPKNILNIEVASLFFYRLKEYYMKTNGEIFFVITKGIITGSHASRFRNFKDFSDIVIWSFDKTIEKIFNIDFICLYARKSSSRWSNELVIPNYYHKIMDNNLEITYFSNLSLKVEKVIDFIPYHIEKKGNRTYTYKLVPKDSIEEIYPVKPSYYKKLFHKGADLNPRNLIFVNYENINSNLAKINPDPRIFERAKAPWHRRVFKDEIIELKYIFKVMKSTELINFHIYDSYQVFLPLDAENLEFNYTKLSENARKFYDTINQIYMNTKKETTKNKSLMENLNRWSKLINQRQLSPMKVVYNNSGSNLYSAVVKGKVLITGDLSFFVTQNESEAYYLSAILNSNILNKQIRIKKSSRHIFKIPFETPIRKFDTSNPNHLKLVQLGMEGETIALQTIKHAMGKSKMVLQKLVRDKINSILDQIDELIFKDFEFSVS